MMSSIWLRAAFAGCIGALVVGVYVVPPMNAMAESFRNASDAPPSWGAFATRLKSACESALQANDPIARRLNDTLEKIQAAAKPDELPLRVKVSLWIASSGVIDRVAFAPLPSEQAASDLNALLMRGSVGAPPGDMLQPVQLSLSLKPRK